MNARQPHSTIGNEIAASGAPAAELLTVAETCARLRISRWMFYRLVHDRKLATIRIGSRRLVTPDAVNDLIATLATAESDQL